MSYPVGRRGPRTLRAACTALLALGMFYQTAVASGCDTNMGAAPALYSAVYTFQTTVPVRRAFIAPVESELMLFSIEHGVDVALQVTDAAELRHGRGDNPIRRTGVQRVRFTANKGAKYTLELTAKEQGDPNASVEIRIVDLRRSGAAECLAVQNTLARADAAYAEGQAMTRDTNKASGASAERSYREAASAYREAAASLQAQGPSQLLAHAQLAAGSILYFELDQFADAQTWAQNAAQTYASLGDSYAEARAEAIRDAAETEDAVMVKKAGSTDSAKQASDMLADARTRLAKVIAFHARRKDLYDQAWAQNYVGAGFYYEGRYDEAIEAYKKALTPYEAAHQRNGQVQVLQNVALMEYELGRFSSALAHFRRALGLIRSDDNPRLYASILANGALTDWASGNQDRALRQSADSLLIARRLEDTNLQIVDLQIMAAVYATLGEQDRALELYRQTLDLLNVSRNGRLRTAALRSMANILRQQGKAQDALTLDQEALAVAASSATRPRVQVQIARDLIELGRLSEAGQTLQTVLDQSAGGDDMARARALRERAGLRARSGNPAGAEADLKRALPVFRSYEAPVDEFEAWLLLARLADQRHATAEAFSAVDRALALAESVRLQSANPELRSTLLQPLRPAFDLRISMLYRQYAAAAGRPAEQAALALRALETAEQARARALADYQTLDASAPGLDPALAQRRQTLYRELAARRFRLEANLDKSGSLDARSEAIRAEIASLRQELDQIDARIGAASESARMHRPGTNNRGVPLREGAMLAGLERIPEPVAVTEYWLGSPDAYAWVVTRGGVTMIPLGPSAPINAAAAELHTALRSFGSVERKDRLAASDRLHRLVLGPLEPQIAGKRTLIFAADGRLHYVPFATLTREVSGRREFLVETHDIAITPSVHMFLRPAAPTRSVEPRRMLLVDDPVYDPADTRLARLDSSTSKPQPSSGTPALALVRGNSKERYLPRLPGAAKEASAIGALMPPGSVDRLDGLDANRDRFLGMNLDRYGLIHVATHASTDPEIPQASALILSTVNSEGAEVDGRVLAADFMGVRLAADIVVLSACDTALGKSVAGEGLIGLQYIVLARGARSVVSSLWPAIDQVTAQLMVRFYSSLLNQRTSVISAWSAASRAMLQGPYADPGTWGAFMLTLSHVEDVSSP